MQRRPPRPSWLVITITLLAAFQIATPVWAWGRLGHRVISRLAEKRLASAAKAAIAQLLEPGESLADASLWADENRRRLPKTAPWHYVDVPLDEPRYDSKFSGDVSSKGCVVEKINEFRLVVKDKSKSVEDRRFALRFLVHCVEDMHQPCHVGDKHDRGGNDTQVRFFDRGTNMHSLWDTGMIERFSKSEDEWLKELTVLASPQSQERTSERTVEDWATESLSTARTAYQDPTTGERIKPGTKFGQEYYDANLPVVRQRMVQAASRLARVLNEAYQSEHP
jgi:nuclease S1